MSSALGSSSDSSETRDFDEEARKIFSSLGVTGTGKRSKTKSQIYIYSYIYIYMIHIYIHIHIYI